MDWKIVATVLIMGIVLAAGFSLGPFAEFANALGEKVSFSLPDIQPARNVSFELAADSYGNVTFSGTNARLILQPQAFTADVKGGRIETNGSIAVQGFRGAGTLSGKTLELQGTYKKIEVAGAMFAEGSISGSGSFGTLVMDNVTIAELSVAGNAVLSARGAELRLADKLVVLQDVLGTVEIADGIMITGAAASLSVPDIRLELSATG
ncbi:MAG: hypothetical protein HYY37_04590 [Candidatus Aenigmarchaeota archaeon]|nr:hypothetical protein [Candidatus Aenigmarchaeota archaeon]